MQVLRAKSWQGRLPEYRGTTEQRTASQFSTRYRHKPRGREQEPLYRRSVKDPAMTSEESKQPDAAVTAATVSDDAKLPYFNDPRFQVIYEEWRVYTDFFSCLTQMLCEGRYSIKDLPTLKAVHEDAFNLYDVAGGKKAASELLATLERNIPPELFSAIVIDLANFVGPRLEKFLRETTDPALDDGAKLRAMDLLESLRNLATAQRAAELPCELKNPGKGVN